MSISFPLTTILIYLACIRISFVPSSIAQRHYLSFQILSLYPFNEVFIQLVFPFIKVISIPNHNNKCGFKQTCEISIANAQFVRIFKQRETSMHCYHFLCIKDLSSCYILNLQVLIHNKLIHLHSKPSR